MDLMDSGFGQLADLDELMVTVARGGGGSKPLVLLFGDSQIPGEAPTDAADPAFNVAVTQSTSFVHFDKHYAQSAADPPSYQTDIVGGVQPYTIGGTPGMGMEISIGQELTKLGLPCALAVFGIAGLSCSQSLPASTYPTAPPNIWNQMVSRIHGLESSLGATTKVALISEGNNDGGSSTDAANLATNSATLAAALRAAFPGITILWIKINADTVNAPGFNFVATAISNQATFFANDSGIVPIYNDDCPLQTDHAHFTADTALTVGQRAVKLMLSALGISVPRPAAFPMAPGFAPQTVSTGATQNPHGYGGTLAGDIEILVRASLTASGTNNAFSTPATSFTAWAPSTGYLVGDRRDANGNSYECITAGTSSGSGGPSGTGSNIADGTGGTAVHWKYIGQTWVLIGTTTSTTGGATTRAAFYQRTVDATMIAANHGNTAPTIVPGANSNEFAAIVPFRGPSSTASTIGASALSKNDNFNTSLTFTGFNTQGANRTIAMITVGFRTNASANAVSISAPNLSGITVVRNGTRDSGLSDFCTIDVQTAQLAAQGPTGNPVATFAQSTIAVGALLEIAPSP